MRKRVFGSIFLTALVTLLLTASLLLIAVHSGLSHDMRGRLANECSYIAAAIQDDDWQELVRIGRVYADRITLIGEDGAVLYDNESDVSGMENHASRPEVAAAMEKGVGESSRLSDTLSQQTYYYALRLGDGMVLRVASTADSALGALSTASPWIVLIILLALLVAAVLASWLTHVFLEPIVSLDLHEPLKNDAYDELSPLLHRMDKQNRKIASQLNELKRRQAEFDDITARMDEGLVLFSAQGDILFANRAVCALFPEDSATGGYMTLCRDPEYVRVVEEALGGESAHGRMEKDGAALCGTVRDRLQHKAAEHKIMLSVAGAPVTVSGQRRTLEQMVFNLADNAIAYNRPGGSVLLETGEEGGAPFVRVSDTGIGIAPADQQRVFERFYRVDKSHSKMTGGTGLGLSIVKHGAAMHHAQIEMQSALGEGTKITLRFPKTQAE